MEIFNYQNETDELFFDALDQLTDKALTSIIQNELTALMSIRRRRTVALTSNELMGKLYNPPTKKTGEHKELIEVMHTPDEMNASGITPRLAGELADHAYYRLQDNIPEPESFKNWYDNHYLQFIGIEKRSILIFCILKYTSRIEHGDEVDTKDKEHDYLNKYINNHPELRNIWSVEVTEKNSPLFNLIESMI